MGWEKKESTILPFKVQSCRLGKTLEYPLEPWKNWIVKGKGDENSIEK